MEGNRDEAERCIAIAVQALREAKIEKAEKFLNKAEKLYPSQKAKGKQVRTWQMCISLACIRYLRNSHNWPRRLVVIWII